MKNYSIIVRNTEYIVSSVFHPDENVYMPEYEEVEEWLITDAYEVFETTKEEVANADSLKELWEEKIAQQLMLEMHAEVAGPDYYEDDLPF